MRPPRLLTTSSTVLVPVANATYLTGPRAIPSQPCTTPGPGPPSPRAPAATIAARTQIPTVAYRRLRILASRLASREDYACRARKGPSARLRQRRVDLTRQRGDLLGQLLVLPGQVRVGREELLELVGLGLQRGDSFRRVPLYLVVPLLGRHGGNLVPLGLARLRQQDQRRRVGGLGGEAEIQEDERFRVPVVDERDGVEDDPGCNDERLADDVLRRAKEASSALGRTAKGILAEGAVLLLGHGASVHRQADTDLTRVSSSQRASTLPK